jgi:hypothetical protein
MAVDSWVVYLSIMAAAQAAPFPAPLSASPTVVVSYRGERKVVLRQPVVLQFRVDNQGFQPVRFDLGFNRTRNFLVTITQPNGQRFQAPLVPAVGGGDQVFAVGRRRLLPGEQYVQQLLLNEWFPFAEPGRYTVDIRLRTDILSDSGSKIEASSNGVISVDVGPRDDRVLQTLADELVEQILTTRDVGERYAAARILSHMTDPVAIEYMRRVIERTDAVDHILIDGLKRIGTSDSAALLTQLAASHIDSRASWAQEALRSSRSGQIK